MIDDPGEVDRLVDFLKADERRAAAHGGRNHSASRACAECRAVLAPEHDAERGDRG